MGKWCVASVLVAGWVVQLGAGNGRSASELTFELSRGHLIVVRGASGGATDLRFLLDTGASTTVIAAPLAAGLQLRGQTSTVETFGRTMAALAVEIPDLQFGAIRVERHPALVADLSGPAASLDLSRLDAIVGIDVLGRTSLGIDYGRQRLTFGRRRSTRYRVPLRVDARFPVVRIEVGGELVDLVVDTGASHIVLFRQGGEREPRHQPGQNAATALTGPTTVQGLLLPEMRAGTWLARDVAIVLAHAAGASTHLHGLLAPTALRSRYVQLDFERRELGWSP